METVNHETYVSLEVAKLLEKAGFDWVCRDYYYPSFMTSQYREYAKPTLDVAQRWLREVKNMSVEILFEKPGKWSCSVILDTNKEVGFENLWREEFDYDTYEEAQEASIKKALEIILEKGE